jgi:hypothetical protein
MSGMIPGIGRVPDPGFAGDCSGHGSDQDASSFRLPPVIDDGGNGLFRSRGCTIPKRLD